MSREQSLPATGRRPSSSFGLFALPAALALACLLAAARPCLAQKVEETKNTPDSGRRGEMRVDPSTLALGFHLTLGNYPGRAGSSLPVTVSYSSKVWRINFHDLVGPPSQRSRAVPKYAEHSASGWTTNMDVPTLEGLEWTPYDALGAAICASPSCPPPDPETAPLYVYRLLAHMPDGSTHELRRDDTPTTTHASGSNVYHAVDGSRMRYEEASDTLLLPDGSRYKNLRVPSNGVRYVDRNGNTLAYDQATKEWTDTLGRAVGRPPLSAASSDDVPYSIPGVNGVPVTYTFRWRHLAEVLPGGQNDLHYTGDRTLSYPMQTLAPSLFHTLPLPQGYVCTETEAPFNPVVLAEVGLPNGTKYTFGYNVYGEIDRVVYPTGGYERYVYAPVDGINSSLKQAGYAQGNRGVVERHVSATGAAADEAHWYYAATNNDFTTPYKVTITAPDQTRTERLLHGGRSDDVKFGFEDARNGMAYDERVYAADNRLLRRTLTEWTKTGPLGGGAESASRNPRVVKRVEIVADTGGDALTTTTDYGYDQDLNVVRTRRYGFASVSQATAAGGAIGEMPLGALVRTEEATYLVNDAGLPQATRDAYRARNLLGLATATLVKDASGAVVARGEVRYDEAAYAPLPCGAGVGWADPGAAVRGSATTARAWLDTAGTWVETHAQFDACGSPRKSWDAHYENAGVHGHVSEVEYSAAYQYAYPTLTTTAAPNASAVPDPAGGTFAAGTFGSTTGLTSSAVYDFSTGLVTRATDTNGQTTSYDYTDPLNRLKRVDLPGGGRTTYNYVDAHACGPYVEARTLLDDAGREVASWQFFDGLGRPYLSESADGQDPSNPYLRVDTRYDSQGRVSRVSNPYRTSGCTAPANPPGLWTTTGYDALGRVQSVTTPDGAKVETSYVGNTVTVNDQHAPGTPGHPRRSVTDALGRLVRVDEPHADTGALDNGGNPVQPTSYTYDALGNLRTVSQGTQTRTFVYDSLSRLTSATNPESGTVSYGYDANGNLTSRADARGVQTAYTYDALNRSILVHYAGGGTATPDVRRYYDNPAAGVNGRGRPHWTEKVGVSANVFDSYDAMGRPTLYHQVYWTAAPHWGQPFNVSRAYDKAGNVTSQTYPSGHAVTYNYDAAGRVGDNGAQSAFTGNLGDGVSRTYASAVTYSEFGGLRQERFGTQTPLYNKRHYNVRGQLTDVRLSIMPWSADKWNGNRGAIINYYATADLSAPTNDARAASGPDNNGNVIRQQHWAPGDDGYGTYNFTEDRFTYDALNRLKAAEEYHGWQSGFSGRDWAQAYDYDRWGNRTVDPGRSSNVPVSQYDFERGELAGTNRLLAPGDLAHAGADNQNRRMRYDAAGNLTHDGHTGKGGRTYDAENRMTGAVINQYGDWALYTYDADGRRVKSKIGGEEWWQVYGMGGELLAEYRAGAATYLPSKEYGYRGGELLVTMSSGDDLRLRRFVHNLYYGALQRDPTAQELEEKTNQLAAAGVQGQAQLLAKAQEIARSLFLQTNYETSPFRSDTQYVHDLYYAYMQRAPDDAGLAGWVAYAATSRANACTSMEGSAEFAAVVSTLREVSGAEERRDRFIQHFYLAATGAGASASELQQRRAELDAAAAAGPEAVRAAAEAMGRQVFAAQVTNVSIPAEQFVTNLYEGFLQRGPDAQGLSHWVGAAAQSRQHVLDAFAVCDPFKELAGTLYRETFWLVGDQLGTPRMIADRTGSLAGVKRHDYLPFGEELSAGAGGRATAQGYGAADNIRQKFTGYDRDGETGLDYAKARYYASAQGRFTSCDPLLASGKSVQPQSWNRYSYTINNPLKYVDPTGLIWMINYETNQLHWYAEIEKAPKGFQVYLGPLQFKIADDRWVWLNPRGPSRNSNDGDFDRQGWAYGPAPIWMEPGQPKLAWGNVNDVSWEYVGYIEGARGLLSAGRGLLGFLKAADGMAEAGTIRTAMGIKGSSKNVGFANFEIEGQAGKVIRVSGPKDIPENALFEPFEVGGYLRNVDSEYKIFEHIGAGIKNPQAKGVVDMFTERPPCPSCSSVADQFRAQFPNVQVNITHGGKQ